MSYPNRPQNYQNWPLKIENRPQKSVKSTHWSEKSTSYYRIRHQKSQKSTSKCPISTSKSPKWTQKSKIVEWPVLNESRVFYRTCSQVKIVDFTALSPFDIRQNFLCEVISLILNGFSFEKTNVEESSVFLDICGTHLLVPNVYKFIVPLQTVMAL